MGCLALAPLPPPTERVINVIRSLNAPHGSQIAVEFGYVIEGRSGVSYPYMVINYRLKVYAYENAVDWDEVRKQTNLVKLCEYPSICCDRVGRTYEYDTVNRTWVKEFIVGALKPNHVYGRSYEYSNGLRGWNGGFNGVVAGI